jgi:sucrose phosphorylase
LKIEVLVEIHSHHLKQVEIAKHVDRVYDFALPPLILHALFKADATPLKRWLAMSPRNAVTVLDTHDGIGVIDVGADASDPKNLPGLLAPSEIDDLVETMHERSGGQSRKATGAAASNLDLYQVNCTYYDALGRRDLDYLIARALQFWAPGVPQVYYVGALGGVNDMDLLARSGVGRDINRHYYTPAEVASSLGKPMVQALIALIRFRTQHPAFNGEFSMEPCAADALSLTWRRGNEWASLDVQLAKPSAVITYTSGSAIKRHELSPAATLEISL